MRHFVKISLVATSLLTVFACAQAPEIEEPSTEVEQAATNTSSSGYVTRDVCVKCGCKATEVACDCGLSGPSDREQKCLDNGGPTKSRGTIGGTLAPAPIATAFGGASLP